MNILFNRMKKNLRIFSVAIGMVTALTNVHAQTTLKDAFTNDFLIGGAVNRSQFDETDQRATAIIKTQFDTVTAENAMKWDNIHPQPGKYNFKPADEFVAFGQSNNMFIVGHNLIWHHEVPDWVFEDDQGNPVTRDALLERMHEHISTVVGRYKGKIGGWDVVDEALNENGALHKSQWMKIIGPEYILKAYQFAHEADPDAQLYYNDFNLENNPQKRIAAMRLIKGLQARGIPVTAVGLKGHYQMDSPATNEVDQTIKAFSKLGVKVMITEMDIDVLPQITIEQLPQASTNLELRSQVNIYTNGLPQAQQKQLAQRYADLFKVFVANRDTVSRITFWGVMDSQSWLNDWPVPNRKSYPLLFGRDYQPKPAFDAVIQVAQEQNKALSH
jgi:endo-1,4-beta-xylanase